MTDDTTSSSLPLRRITRSARIVSSSHLTTRPRIGRLASSTQMLANSLGRPSTVRRSISEAAPVKYPSWLLPSMAGRTDGLDQWRDRDLIAIRRARSKNRVVRQVPPRGLPMASHARGRGRLGEQVAPSSIARRLQPVRRTPTPNDAHASNTQFSAVRPATPRPPRARRLALPPGKSGDREGPAGPRGSLAFGRHASLPLVATARRAASESAEPRSFSAPMPRITEARRRRGTSSQRRHENRATRRRNNPTQSDKSASRPNSTGEISSLRRERPEWTSFSNASSTETSTAAAGRESNRTTSDRTASDRTASDRTTNEVSTTSSTVAPRTFAATTPRVTTPDQSTRTAVTARRSRSNDRRSGQVRRSTARPVQSLTPGWRRVAGVPETTLPTHDESLRRSSARESTLAERVAQLADPSNTPRTAPGALVRRSPVAGSMFSLAAAVASAQTANSRTASNTSAPTASPSPEKRTAENLRRSSVGTSRRSTLPSTPAASTRAPATRASSTSSTHASGTLSPRATAAPLWRRAQQNMDVESAATARRSLSSTSRTSVASFGSRPGDVARRRELASTSAARQPELRRQAAALGARRSPSVDRLLDSASPIRRSALVVAPGGNASSPFIGSLARAVARRQQTADVATNTPSRTPRSSGSGPASSFTSSATSSSASPRTGPGADAAQNFAERLARRTGEPVPAAASGLAARSERQGPSFGDTSDSTAESPISDLVSRSIAAREASISPTLLRSVSDGASTRSSATSNDRPVRDDRSRGSNDSTDTMGYAVASTSRAHPNSGPSTRIAYRAATAPRPAAVRRSMIDDLPVAPIVLPPNRDASGNMSTSTISGTSSTGAGSGQSSSTVGQSSSSQSSSRDSNRNTRAASRSVSVRRSSNTNGSGSIRRSSSTGGSDDAISADALARMIEHGFEPDLTRTISRRVAGTTSSPVRRSPSGATHSASPSGSTSSSAVIRRSNSGLASIAPGPIAIVGTVSGGSDSTESSSGGVTTSQLLDLIDWINRVVDERLRLEMERRGMTGGRW